MLALTISSFLTFLKSAIFVVGYIQNNITFPEPLSPNDEKIYIQRLKHGDEESRNILIERNLRLVAHICKKYSTTNIEQDDLISIGTIARHIGNAVPVDLGEIIGKSIIRHLGEHLGTTKTHLQHLSDNAQ